MLVMTHHIRALTPDDAARDLYDLSFRLHDEVWEELHRPILQNRQPRHHRVAPSPTGRRGNAAHAQGASVCGA